MDDTTAHDPTVHDPTAHDPTVHDTTAHDPTAHDPVADDPATRDTTRLDDLYDAPGDGPAEAPPARTHPLDLFSLVAGLLALVGGGLYLLGELTDLDVDGSLVVAAAVVVLGAAGVLLALRRGGDR